jgi:hypothetical protein
MMMLLIVLFGMTAISSGFLNEGYVASSGSSIAAQYFTDPIFFTKVPASQPLGFYTPYIVNLSYYPAYSVQSQFENSSITALPLQPFNKWATSSNFVQGSSSVKVYSNGAWTNV